MRSRFALFLITCLLWSSLGLQAQQQPNKDRRDAAQKLQNDGNFNEAYEAFVALTTDPAIDNNLVVNDFNSAVYNLSRLNRWKEFDAYREKVVETHPENWRVLQAVAQSYMNQLHNGYMIAGEFERGHHRGGGQVMHATERDRVRALQLYEQAMPLVAQEKSTHEAAQFYLNMAAVIMGNRGYQGAWRLGYLTDITELPDYEDGWGGYYGGTQGAPVDEAGNPIFHQVPASWDAAETDGERWRWLQVQAMETNPAIARQVQYQYASFLQQQFGVQTLASYGYGRFWGAADTGDDGDSQRGIMTLHTLEDNETVAKLATGVKRFTLPDDANFVAIFKSLGKTKAGYGENALQQLSAIYLNRRQYPKAADTWRQNIDMFGPGHRDHKKRQLEQIVDPWGRFEPSQPQAPSETGATVPYRFRNGKSVAVTAYPVKVQDLIADAMAYLKTNPPQLDGNQYNIQNIGYRLLQENQERYLAPAAHKWTVELTPRANHFDKQIALETPLKSVGVYWLEAQMADGNIARTMVWIDDTVIVRKQLDQGLYYFIADAKTGEPLPDAKLDFFGFRQDYIRDAKRGERRYNITTDAFEATTDELGQYTDTGKERHQYQWLVTAQTKDGRFAYYGWHSMHMQGWYDQDYNQQKIFGISDRPVYRPDQAVKFKFWANQAQYDREGKSPYAGQTVTVIVNDPKGEKVFDKAYTFDDYGGIDGEFTLAADATLGQYGMFIHHRGGHISFRVEEYKKPEYEVVIEAPTKPVALGEKITATIEATYFFGAPVTNAKVKYKVTRQSHDARWYPVARWDWLYGKGYWWYAYDYAWYPGWDVWGCLAPYPWWRPQSAEPPEIVAEVEAEIGEDGKLTVPIDTSVAAAIHGNQDHRYTITAEVVDQSRRTIVGSGDVLVAREPFKVYAWLDRGHYATGDTIHASFNAQTLDARPVDGRATITLYQVRYDGDGQPIETAVQTWDTQTGPDGRLEQKMVASEPGQYRVACAVTDEDGHTIEGAYVFIVTGPGFDGGDFRFNALELIPDKGDYTPGETVTLRVNTAQEKSTVLLFPRSTNGVYLKPRVLRLDGKSTAEAIAVAKKDMPNFFIEALTVSDARVHTQVREIVVPPEKRVLNVEVLPSQTDYLPGAEASMQIRLTDHTGEPFVGSTVVSVYDKSVEYISGGSNVAEIKDFFWKWRRSYHERTEHSLAKMFTNYLKGGDQNMGNLGVFGNIIQPTIEGEVASFDMDDGAVGGFAGGRGAERQMMARSANALPAAPSMSMAKSDMVMEAEVMEDAAAPMEANRNAGYDAAPGGGPSPAPNVEAAVRENFADTAFWTGSLETDQTGVATIKFDMPENLTAWKVRTWAMGDGTRVGESTIEVRTTKNVIVRLQAPRFFVEKDEIVLSANVHNYLKTQKQTTVELQLSGGTLAPLDGVELTRIVTIPAGGEQRVDWRVKAVREGEATIRMSALTDEESDAMQMRFPVKVHGITKMVPYSAHMRPDVGDHQFTFSVPEQRRVETGRLELRYSPTLAGAMVDALPYMVSYPYGCTEQTLNRFLPTVITQKILLDMDLDLADIRDKKSNLNAQEIGDDKERAAQWKRQSPHRILRYTKDGDPIYIDNPVWDHDTVRDMIRVGIERLGAMQLSDGGWGWFSGHYERSSAHTTAYVVHGLQVARENDATLPDGMLAQGVAWLQRYQAEQVQLLKNGELEKRPDNMRWKRHPDHLDAFVYMVLVDADITDAYMNKRLYDDRNQLAVYAKSMLALAFHKQKQADKVTMLRRNIEQYLKTDAENQTAWLDLQNGSYWYYWYGSEYEAHAYYLKLLAAIDPKSDTAAWMVKYLLNNRKNATYWNSTRDTSLVIEAFADYMRASGEDQPDMTVEIRVDGKPMKEVQINKANIFTFDNKLVLTGNAVTSGEHTVEIVKKGSGPLYINNYVSYFSLEDFIEKAGLEIKVERMVYKLIPVDKEIKVAGSRGQAVDQKVEKYERQLLDNMATLTSGDLIEVELVIESKNDYEYISFEDYKAAGFEAVALQSGYVANGLGAYMELRDDRVAFFVSRLARGKHSLNYRLRAEIPGTFSALPTVAQAMYAPELRGNSDEIKLQIEDRTDIPTD